MIVVEEWEEIVNALNAISNALSDDGLGIAGDGAEPSLSASIKTAGADIKAGLDNLAAAIRESKK